MAVIDVFNGDADGICALLQWRLHTPKASRLVTGVKRDIELVAEAGIAAGDDVTVLDISFDKNRQGVIQALQDGASIFYCDHHFAGELPEHPCLRLHINTAPEVCTSLLINGYLQGAFPLWAIAGAFGDNLDASADVLVRQQGLGASDRDALREMGILINYNGYGPSLDDLHLHPARLYEALLPFSDPRQAVQAGLNAFELLRQGYADDNAAVAGLKPQWLDERCAVYVLPDMPWARRVSGVFSNDLVNQAPDRAHAVLSAKAGGGFVVSVRAPLNRREGADTLCRQFATGGGRAAAAGINHLPEAEVDRFLAAFRAAYAI